MRSLRWRLTLLYALVLAALLLVFGFVVNVLVGRVLYTNEFASFKDEARITVAGEQPRFQTLVQGRTVLFQGRVSNCVAPLSYQEAFAEAIANPLTLQHGVQAVYLLDTNGTIQAPSSAVGQTAPNLRSGQLSSLVRLAEARSRTVMGYLDSTAYPVGAGAGQVGVALVAIRFRTTSSCLVPETRPVVGVVEVVTTFPVAHTVLAGLRFVLVLAAIGVLLAVIVVGGPLTARALKPLTRMTHVARQIASGDLSQRVRLPHGGDEIGQLTDTFDDMIARLEAAFGAQAASEARMRQFIADASHELRTPLTAIRGYTDVLLRGAAHDDPATAEQVLLATSREAERMSRLVNDLLTLARMDAGRPLERKPIDLVALAGEAVDQARILAGEREVSLTTDGGGRLMVPADPDRLKQVLLILLDNALKYGLPAPEGWARVRVGRTEHGAVLHVADNGQGIAPEDLAHIFDRFYRGERAARQRRITGVQVAARPHEPPVPNSAGVQDGRDGAVSSSNRVTSGSGLGLAIAQAIVQAHRGALTVQSQWGVGTTFTIALPRT
jgi:two-component system OmpR family sensor kinase